MKIYQINPENFNRYQNSLDDIINKPSMCGIFSKTCHHCNDMKPAWNLLKTKIAGQPGNGNLLEIDNNVIPLMKNYQFTDRIKGYPTIIIIKKGISQDEYMGDRSFDSLYNYFKTHIKSPDSKSITNISSPSINSYDLKLDKKSRKKIRKDKKPSKKRKLIRLQNGGSKKKLRRKNICTRKCQCKCPVCNKKKYTKNKKKIKKYKHKHKH